uniref:Putative secreted protein n=1 Tax=Ixodes ricinus TaxID=34613 RepID=A0A6B0UB38_IXORI
MIAALAPAYSTPIFSFGFGLAWFSPSFVDGDIVGSFDRSPLSLLDGVASSGHHVRTQAHTHTLTGKVRREGSSW